MRAQRSYRYIAQAALIGTMLIAIDVSLFEALRHMLR
jgi:hypothetical protein